MSTLTPDDAVRIMATGFKWEAALFLTTWESISRKFGEETARTILGEAMYEAGLRVGRLVARQTGRTGLEGIKTAWEALYGPQNVVEDTPETYCVKGTMCAAYELWKALGVPEEQIRKLADTYCIGDRGFSNGIDQNVKFHHEYRIMKGDACCQWVHKRP